MSNKSGFTLVELLAVIVLLAIVLAIAIPSISNIIDNTKRQAFVDNEKMMINATKTFVGIDYHYIPVNIGDTTEVKLSDLQVNDFIGTIKSPGSNTNCNGYILITKTGADIYEYTPVLNCVNNIGSSLEDGLVGYWKLDGNAYDFSPSKKHGTIINAVPTINHHNESNKALNFNGTTSYVSIPLMNYEQFSIEAWFYRNVKDTSNADAVFGGWYWDPSEQLQQGYDIRFYVNSDRIDFPLLTQDSSGTKTMKTVSCNLATNSAGMWHHVVGTYDKASGYQKLYVDGNLIGSYHHPDNNTVVYLTNYPNMRIGGSRINDGYLDGKVDDVRIYNRALTADEIKYTYFIESSIK